MLDKIIIASNSKDRPNLKQVGAILEKSGYNVISYEPDRIVSGELDFKASFSSEGAAFHYDGIALNPESVRAGWFRRPSFYGDSADDVRLRVLHQEYVAIQKNFWACVPESVWLNSPESMQTADVKFLQLKIASSLGFHFPEVVVSNSWDHIESLEHEKLIVKLIEVRGLPFAEGKKTLPTTVVSRDALPKQATPYPGLWQPYIEKKREWRVTVVGEKVFSAAIYTEDYAKDDWRVHQFGPGVTFRAEPFPDDLAEKCVALLKHFNLRYGAFDFIETPDGEMVFLEVNANGQFMWLEQQLGLPISEAIASELISIARENS